MKTRLLTTILTSAYLSAMLASSVAPLRNDARLAATIDPLAAQKALRTAVEGLNASKWAAAAAPSAAVPTPTPVSIPAPKADPVMTEELMTRLVEFVSKAEGSSWLDARVCKVLDLCDGTAHLMLRIAERKSQDGDHWFGIPAAAGTRDVLIMVKHDTLVETYLTDKTGKLRAAAVLENGVARLITNEKAAAKYQPELSAFARSAAKLPPAGAAVAGNS